MNGSAKTKNLPQTIPGRGRMSTVYSLFHTPDEKAFATIDMGSHQENWPLRSKWFGWWLGKRLYQEAGKPPSRQNVREILGTIEGEALYASEMQEVHVRVARVGDAIYIDLGNSTWAQIEITEAGWRIVSSKESPVRFVRTPDMQSLPLPVKGGSINALRPFLNVEDDHQWVLIVSWLIGALRPEGPFAFLVLQGGPDSGKSTTTRFLRDIIDPCITAPRTPPRTERDLVIWANENWLIAFENVSAISQAMSDALCRLSTGGGFGKRKQYTDDSQILFNLIRPAILNGIADIVRYHDLADRSVTLNLPQVPDSARKTNRELEKKWQEARPGILGALCDAMSAALANLDKTELDWLPRMADFAQWVTAAESALPWREGTFIEEYKRHCEARNDARLEDDSVGPAVLELIAKEGEFSGTATELQKRLKNTAYFKSNPKPHGWPEKLNVLSRRLMQLAGLLKDKGIEVTRGKSGSRHITIRKVAKETAQTDQTDQHSEIIPSTQGRSGQDIRPFVEPDLARLQNGGNETVPDLGQADDRDDAGDLNGGAEEGQNQSSSAKEIEYEEVIF